MNRFVFAVCIAVARRFVSLTLAFAVVLPALLAGCGHSDPVAQAISQLAGSGIAVYESYAATRPLEAPLGRTSAVKLTRWQLANLLAQAKSGAGWTGSDLDRIAASPKGAPAFSYFVGAWLARPRSDLARYAATFMPKNANYKLAPTLNYPLYVLVLFVADIARKPAAAAPPQSGFNFERLFAAPAMADTICGTVSNFIDGMIADVISAIQIDSDSTIATVFNTIVDIGVHLVLGAVKTVLAPLLKAISVVAGIISLVAMVASTLQAWNLSMQVDNDVIKLGDQPVDGKFTAVLDAPSLPVPGEVVACGQALAGIDLSTVNFKDAPVDWQTSGDIPSRADVKDKQTTIQDDKTATLSFTTHSIANVPKAECSTEQLVGSTGARATVKREDVLKLEKELTKALVNQLPDFVAKNLQPFFDKWTASAQQSFQNLVSTPVTAANFVQLSELQEDKPSKCTPAPKESGNPPGPNPSSNPSSNPSASPDNTALVGSWSCASDVTFQNKELGEFHVTVNSSFNFTKNGIASGGAPGGAVRTGPRNYSNGAQQVTTGSGGYTYIPTGADSGKLHVDNRDYVLAWHGHDAWSAPATSPASKKTYLLKCTRD